MRAARITTNIAHLSAARLKPIEFPIPDLATQRSLVERTNGLLEGLKWMQGARSAVVARGSLLRRAVLAAAFDGRLTGRSTDTEIIEERAESLQQA